MFEFLSWGEVIDNQLKHKVIRNCVRIALALVKAASIAKNLLLNLDSASTETLKGCQHFYMQKDKTAVLRSPSCYLLEVLLSLSWRSSTVLPLSAPPWQRLGVVCSLISERFDLWVSDAVHVYFWSSSCMDGTTVSVKQQQVPCYCVWVKRVLSVSWAVPRWLPSVVVPVCWADDGDSASGCVSVPPRCISQHLGSLQQDLAAPIPSRVDHSGCCS